MILRRHQIYLIARVTPHGRPLSETKYRCIATLRDSWCKGRLPLVSAIRFITLIKQKENAEIIREEIQGIHGLYGIFRIPPHPPNVPCPFTHFLLHSAWTVDLTVNPRRPFGYGDVLPLRKGTMDGNINDGITIIDVTNPESPAFCLVFVRPSKHRPNAPLMTPLSASQFYAYYPEPPSDDEEDNDAMNEFIGMDQERKSEEERRTLAALHSLESVPMITINMLAEAWPGEYMPDPSGLSLESKELGPTAAHILPSLVDLMFVPALNHALDTGEMDCLDPVMWLPGNASKIKEALRARNPLSATDFAFLTKIIPAMQTKSIDLSHFSLTGEQVIELLSAQDDVEVLNLSHMQHITTNVLRKLIPILPKLRRLVLLHTISDADVFSLLSESPELFYHIDSFIHLAFLRPPDQAAFPFAFSHVITQLQNWQAIDAFMISLPYFTPDQLVQGLLDYFSTPNLASMLPGRGVLPLATYASAVREPGRSWAERIVPFIPGRAYNNKVKEHGGWLLAWPVPTGNRGHRYAFAKIDKEAMEECQQRINRLRSLSSHESQVAGELGTALEDSSIAQTSLSDEEIRVKEAAIRSEYVDREFRIFDIESFFQELVKEGRSAPSPDPLTKLLKLFATFGEGRLLIMTPVELRSYLDTVEQSAGY